MKTARQKQRIEVTVPKKLLPAVIGKGGSTIKSIQTTTQTTITIQNETAIIEGDTLQNVNKAKEEINKIVKPVQEIFTVPSTLHKYIIGEKGKTLNGIQTKTNTRIELEKDSVIINAIQQSDIQKAKNQLLLKLREFGWFYNEKTKTFEEHNKIDALYSKWHAQIDKEAQLRNELFEKSRAAYERGDKKLAKELSDEAKKHDAKMKQLQTEVSIKMFEAINHTPNTFDLHGLIVEEALKILDQKITEAQKAKQKLVTIIPGKGNHSLNNKAKVKPAVLAYLKSKNYKIIEDNGGSFLVQIL